MKHLPFYILMIGLSFLLSCSDDPDDSDSEFKNQYSFTIDGDNYSFDDFDVSTQYLESNNRIFISKEEDGKKFNMNFPLDLVDGANGMDWNGGGVWFFARIPKGDFYTLDESLSTMNVIDIDTVARTISATFEGIGAHGIQTETIVITNGVIKAKY